MRPGRGFRDASERSWEIAPGGTRTEPPALFDPEELPRILGVAEDSTMQVQMDRVHGGARDHAATKAYLFRDVRLCAGHLVHRACIQRISASPVPWFANASAPRLEHATLASTAYGARFFGHWMLDDLPLALAAERLGNAIDVLQTPSAHQSAYVRMSGIVCRTVLDARIRELVVLDDVGQNDFKAERLEDLRRRLESAVASGPAARGVMVLRKDTGKSRLLVNELEIARWLEAQGFEIVSPLEVQAEDLVRTCSRAQVVVGVEGSHLTHAVLCMRPQSTLVTIQPPTRFDAVLKDWCDCKGVRYGFVLGDPVDGGGFAVTMERIDRLLQQIL